jgi:CheY-like chemotaxis protein
MDDLLERLLPRIKHVLGPLVDLWYTAGARVSRIDCDPVIVERAVLTVAQNTRDALPGGGRVMVATEDIAGFGSMGPRFAITLVQQPGAPRETPPQDVFERVSADVSVDESDIGRGGLMVTRRLVQHYGGDVQLFSEPGGAVTYRLEFPAVRHHIGGASGSMILVADDEAFVRMFARTVLERAGYQVVAAESGTALLQVLEVYREIALVVLDVMMPRLDGWAAYEEIRRRRPNVPIIVSSALPMSHVSERENGGRPLCLLPKPYRPVDLLHRVGEALALTAGTI